ncbi:MAG: methyltransferase family protein [Candidatus Limnocylindrales bacterium]
MGRASAVGSAGGGVAAGILSRVGQILVMFALIAALLFGGAGTLGWTWGWLYLAIYAASVAVNAWFMRRRPELVAERGRPADSMTRWDKALSSLWAIAAFVALPLVAGLDGRLGWTGQIDVAWHLLGALMFAAGLGLFGWGMVTNAYFSTVARIQEDRGQQVCRSGPYRLVRHPGYAGTILQAVGAPLLLGSLVALLPGLVAIVSITLRTAFEDRMLQAGLPGYADYAREVRYRLAPRIW